MYTMVEIQEDDFQCIEECTEQILRAGGKLMQKFDDMKRNGGSQNMGERGGMRDYRDGYGMRSGNRGGYRSPYEDMQERERDYMNRGGYRNGGGY